MTENQTQATEEQENTALAALAAFAEAFADTRGRLRRENHDALEAMLNGAPPSAALSVRRAPPFEIEHFTFADLPSYVPEDQDPNILVKGRWLERGGSAFWVSTAGTGKSIHAEQIALCFAEGLPFGGLTPLRPLRIWCFQSEDSASRLVIDREDITAELMDTYPEKDWRETWRKVDFYKYPGRTGVDFLDGLNNHLDATPAEERPDMIILNPLFAFIGGTISDSSYVTPFLRGGTIGHDKTFGLQYILELYKIGVLCYHHTPKPPNDKEIDAWLKTPFPEYQCAGSSDITNWGRSFVTMMRCKDRKNIVCLTAGKNGSELGWDFIDGAHRHYLAWSNGKGITGRGRHAWRELEADELAEITQGAKDVANEDIGTLADILKADAQTWKTMKDAVRGKMTKARFETAWKALQMMLSAYGLTHGEARTGRGKHTFYGTPDGVEKALKQCVENWRNAGGKGEATTNSHQLPPTPTGVGDDTATNSRNAPSRYFNIPRGAGVGSSGGAEAGQNNNQLPTDSGVSQPPESLDDYYLDDPLI